MASIGEMTPEQLSAISPEYAKALAGVGGPARARGRIQSIGDGIVDATDRVTDALWKRQLLDAAKSRAQGSQTAANSFISRLSGGLTSPAAPASSPAPATAATPPKPYAEAPAYGAGSGTSVTNLPKIDSPDAIPGAPSPSPDPPSPASTATPPAPTPAPASAPSSTGLDPNSLRLRQQARPAATQPTPAPPSTSVAAPLPTPASAPAASPPQVSSPSASPVATPAPQPVIGQPYAPPAPNVQSAPAPVSSAGVPQPRAVEPGSSIGAGAGLPDFRAQGGPAAIRFNNPGAMYPGPSAQRFGSTGTYVIGGGHKIAAFPDAVSGAAAQFDLLNRRYTGRSLADAITTWSGGNSSPAYIQRVAAETGIDPRTPLTPEMLANPAIAVPLARAMSGVEAGRPYPLSQDQWMAAHRMSLGGPRPASTSGFDSDGPVVSEAPTTIGGGAGLRPALPQPKASAPVAAPRGSDRLSQDQFNALQLEFARIAPQLEPTQRDAIQQLLNSRRPLTPEESMKQRALELDIATKEKALEGGDKTGTIKEGEQMWVRGPNGEIKWITPPTGSAGSNEFRKASAKQLADTYQDYVKDGQKAIGTTMDLQRMQELSEAVGTGKFAAWAPTVGPWLNSLGIDWKGLSDAQAFQAIANKMGPNMRPAGSGASSDRDMAIYMQSIPQLSQTVEGRRKIIDHMMQLQTYTQQRSQIASDALAGRLSPEQAESRINALQYPYFDKRNAPGSGSSATRQPAQSAQPPQPPQAAIERLRANPAEAAQFDEVFGDGAARRALGQ